ncbi:MAG: FG-GAP-like repeat-containing protein [Bacteroidota bacterium]
MDNLSTTRHLSLFVLFLMCCLPASYGQLPTVTSLSPLLGYPGSTVTVTGTNFNTTPANNIVYFGATRATVTAGGSTSLTATVPIGATYERVSVNNTASALTGYSRYQFLPTYNNSAYIPATVNFDAKTDFTGGTISYSVAIGDIDGDGKPDLAVANHGANTISVYRNTSSSGSITSGSFATPVTFASGTTPRSLAIGDIDGDGKPDLAVGNSGANTVSVLRNTSSSGSITTSSFATHVTFATGEQPWSVAIGDIDGDGKPELAVANNASSTVSVYHNTGSSGSITSGSFATQVTYATGSNPYSVAIGDIDGDGKADLAVADLGSATISVYRNTSSSGSITSGSFAARVTFATGSNPISVAIGDIDGDGKPDMAVANQGSNTISVLRNTSSSGSITTGSFATQITFATGINPRNVAIGDIDGDGKPDLAVANLSSATVSVYRNTSSSGSITSGSFATQVTFATGTDPVSVAMGDIDGDGKPDLVTANNNSIAVSVIRNNPLIAVPAISSVSPAVANTGSTVTITGTNFNTTPANNIVFFGATKATVTAAGSSSLTATVPTGATYKEVSVINTASALTGYSQYPFLPTFNNSAYTAGAVNFSDKVDFSTGTTARGVALGDIDGDGKTDIAVANYGSNTVSVYRNTSSSGSVTSASFAAQVTFVTGVEPAGIAIGDIDGDGKPDMVVTNSGSSTVFVYRNTSSSGSITSSSFASPATFATGLSSYSVAIGDIDGDGKPDMAVTNNSSTTVSVYHNTGTVGSITSGSFATRVIFATASNPLSVAIGDLDGDGKPDLAVANQGAHTVSVFRNAGSTGAITTGTFPAHVQFTAGTNPRSVTIGDIDGDGKLDLAVANQSSANVSVYRNTSSSGSITSSSFASHVQFATGTLPFMVTLGDIDGDGKPDMVVPNYIAGTVGVYRNTGSSGSISSGSFATPVIFATGANPFSVAIGDIDGDGKPDLVTPNNGAATLSVIRNNPVAASLTVTALSPGSANPGATVTLTGTNFNATPANNIVFFGATRATVTAASTTSLTATVPAGATYKEVSVNNTALSLTAYSQYPFLPKYDNSSFFTGLGSFTTKVDYAVGDNPQGVAIGDIDGDGKPDMAVANYSSNTVSVFLNTSTGTNVTYAAKVDFAAASNPSCIAIGDINGDGKQDLVVGNMGANSISVFRNTATSGSVSFATRVDAFVISPRSVAIADIDGDGKPDLATANHGATWATVLRNTSTAGTISFAANVDITIGNQLRSIAVGDIDGDSKPDMVVTSYSSSYVSVLRNTSSIGSILFAAKVDLTTGTNPEGVVLGDIDGDGKTDMLVANFYGPSVSVFRNTGSTGTIAFAAKVDFASDTQPMSIALGDLDGDGRTDMAVTNYYFSTVSVFRNVSSSGTVSFATRSDYLAGTNPSSVAMADMNGDGAPDLAVANYGSNNVSVIRNTPAAVPPTVAAMSPSVGSAGTTVTITGSNFNPTPADNIVFFGATRATVTAAGSTSLTATVPIGSTYSRVSVNNTALSLAGYSQYPFLPTYDNSGYIAPSLNFAGKMDFTAGTTPQGVAIGDVDGDGKADMIVTNLGSATVSVFRNTGSAGIVSYAAKVDLITGANPYGVVIGDVDGDGKLDLVVANSVSHTVSVFRNTGSSGTVSFDLKVDFATALTPFSLAIGDLDGDGKPDLVVGNNSSTSLSIFGNRCSSGTIAFAPKADITGVSLPHHVAIGDVDGDGMQDMVVVRNSTVNNVYVYRHTGIPGTLSFATPIQLSADSQPFNVSIGDLDGDGKPELMVANNNSHNVSVFRNTGSSGTVSFATKMDIATGFNPRSVAVGDMNGDGKADMIVANSGSGTASVFRNTGSIGTVSFAARLDVATGTTPRSIAIGDADGDGKPDVVVGNYGSNNVSVIRNNPLSPITGSANVCTTVTTTLSNATSGGTWSSGATGIATVGSATGIVAGVAAGTATISYTVPGGSATVIVTVGMAPMAITGTATVCVGAATTLSTASSGGTWSSSNTAIGTVSTAGVVTGISEGIATISYSAVCGAAATVAVTVAPLPAAGTISGTATVCAGAATTLSTTGSGGVWSSTNAAAGTVSASGVVAGIASGTTTISYTVTTGCGTAAATQVVTTNPLPEPGTISGTATVCAGAATTLSTTGSGGVWSSTNTAAGTVSTSGVVTGIAVGNTTISYTVTNSCGTAAATQDVTVNPLAMPGTISGSSTVCAGATTTLSTTGSGGMWSSTNIAAATIDSSAGVVAGIAGGTTTISYTVTNGCGTAVATHEVMVNAIPESGTISGPSVVNIGATITLADTTSEGTWSSSNTAVATVGSTGIVTGVSGGNTVISYTVTSTCGSAVATKVVTVNTSVPGTTGDLVICAGSSTTLSNETSGGAWSSNNTGVATVVSSSGIVTGVAAGLATITYTVGADYVIAVVTVNGLPLAISGTLTTCAGASTTLSSGTTGGTWSSTNTAVAIAGSAGAITGVSAGTAAISYTNSEGCARTVTVTVSSAPEAIGGALSICTGATGTLTNASGGGTWSASGSGVMSGPSGGVISGLAAGTANVTYTLSTGCKTTAIVTVTAAPASLTGAGSVCAGSVTTLASTTTGGSWSSSNTGVAMADAGAGAVTGVGAGTAVITYMTGAGCYATKTISVNISPAAIAGTLAVCVGATTALSNATIPGLSWTSGNTAVATINSTSGVVTGVASGTSIITYSLGSGCKTTSIVTVNTLPNAITGTLTACVGMTNMLASTTPGGTWSSSNIAVATIGTAGDVTGVATGTARITYNSGGCYRTVIVTVNAAGPTIMGVGTACVGSNTTLSAGGGTWSSSNAAVASLVTAGAGYVTGVSAGTATITFTPGTGCYSTKVVTINAVPAAITGTAIVCKGSATTLTNSLSGGTWTSGNITVATVGSSTGEVTGVNTGTALISYTISGCRVTRAVTVNNSAPVLGVLTLCTGNSTTLTNTVSGGTWSSSSTAVATVGTTGITTGTSAGTAGITYTTPHGCASAVIVTVAATPSAITGLSTVCAGMSTTFSNSVSGGTWTSSNTAVAAIGTTSGIMNALSNGSTTITYFAGAGCRVTKAVTVSAVAAITSASLSFSICVGSTVVLSNATAGGTWSSSNTAMASIGSSTGAITGIANGTATVSYLTPAGCAATVIVTVNAAASAVGSATLCVNETVTLSSGGGGSWSGTASSVIDGPSGGFITGESPGTAAVTYTLPTGCKAITQITVNPLPANISFTGTSNLKVCPGTTLSLSNVTPGGTWSSSNTSAAAIGTSGMVAGIAPGLTNISYTLATGCYKSVNVTVNPNPAAITGTFSVCATMTTTLSNATTGGASWASGNTAKATVNATNGIVSGVSAGTANITYSLATGCYATQAVTVEACSRPGGSSIDQPAFNSMQLYPNPTTGAFNVVSEGAGTIYLYTMDGKELAKYIVTAGINSFSLPPGIAAGVYMCRYAGSDGATMIVRLHYDK